MRNYVWCVGLSAAIAAGCAAPVNIDQEKAALMDQDKAWSQSTKEVDKMLAYYTDDASVYEPATPVITGAAALRAAFTAMSAMPGFGLTWKATRAEVSASGDVGYTVGAYEMTMNDATGKPQVDKGKYVTIWKKGADGKWKVKEDIFNSDTPPPAPPGPPPAPPTKKK